MKVAWILFLVAFVGCQQNKVDETLVWKAGIQRQSQQKVHDVVEALQRDCDSNLLQMARFKVDSIRSKAKVVLEKKHKPLSSTRK